MADTIITNTPRSSDDAGGAGWLVALVLIFAVGFGGLVLYQQGFFNGNAEDTTNINVSIPDPVTPTPAPTN